MVYVNWLNMVRAGLLALEFYTPEASSWRQVGARGPPQEGRALGGDQDQDSGCREGTTIPTRRINWVDPRVHCI